MIYLTNNSSQQINQFLNRPVHTIDIVESIEEINKYTTISGTINEELERVTSEVIVSIEKLPSKFNQLNHTKFNNTYICVKNKIPKKWISNTCSFIEILDLQQSDFLPKEFISIQNIVDKKLYTFLYKEYGSNPRALKEESIKIILLNNGEKVKTKDYIEDIARTSNLNYKRVFSNILKEPIKPFISSLEKTDLWVCFMGDNPLIQNYIPYNLYCSILLLQNAVDKSYMSLRDATILWATLVDQHINKKIELDFYNYLKHIYGIQEN